MSLVMVPLFAAGASKKGKDSISWDTLTEQAFLDTKSALATATLLHHPQHNANITLTTDASDTSIGARLEHPIGCNWQPLAFLS